MNARIPGLVIKDFAQMLRVPMVLFLILFLTTAELAICTLALDFDVKNLKLAIVDSDRSVASRMLTREFTSGGSFVLHSEPRSGKDALRQLRSGEVDALVEIPSGFSARLSSRRPAPIGVVVDGSNANIAARASAYIVELSARMTRERLAGTTERPTGVQPAVRVWYNPQLTNKRFMGIAALVQSVFMLAIILPAAGIVREKQSGTMEQIRVTPIRAHEFFIGKLIPPLLIGLGSLFPSLLVLLLLGVPMNGNLMTLFAFQGLFLLSGLSMGVFIATLTSTLQQALLGSFFGLFPLLFLSGSTSPIESMPPWLQAGAEVSPIRHYLEIASGLFLKGAGVEELWRHAAALLLISLAMFLGSWTIFRRSW